MTQRIDCRECIHFDICQSCGILTGILTSCPTFKHSSKFVELIEGKWEQIQRWTTKAKYRCSVCNREIMSTPNKVNMEKYPYCHCGVKMVKDGEK